MVEEGRWGIIYCPKGGLLGNPVKRWEQAERCLQAHNIQYDRIKQCNTITCITMQMKKQSIAILFTF
mgnify:CR=1 FL=1